MKIPSLIFLVFVSTITVGLMSFKSTKNSTVLIEALNFDNHDFVVGIPNLSKTEISNLVDNISKMQGVKSVRFCPDLECLIVIKSLKVPASNSSIMEAITSQLPGKPTYIKEITSIGDLEKDCHYKN